ncbi:UNVERIFIED_CONTAM: Major pollen allergen Ole e 10 [Sesamum radiatum]|uniref:Major pollen allergen Ole e 10 n=1 Tax=Sesamum radiatum TaxID=300843 RepID=A0AAW2KIB0_SESRA
MDITTPITTVPTPSNPTLNPTDSNPESPVIMNPANPVMTPFATNSPASSTGSWCIASRSVSQTALQSALDYACGQAGADCSAIQANGVCYNPNTVRDHASYAFNSYFQNNPIPTSCNFGGLQLPQALIQHQFICVEYNQLKRIPSFWCRPTNHPLYFNRCHAKFSHPLFPRRIGTHHHDVISNAMIQSMEYPRSESDTPAPVDPSYIGKVP